MTILSGTIRLRDQFTSTMRNMHRETTGLTSKLKIMNKMVVRPVVRIKDETVHAFSNIKNNITSLNGLLAIGLGAMGINKLGEATVGSAMNLETQMVSMEHWLKGNKQLAQ